MELLDEAACNFELAMQSSLNERRGAIVPCLVDVRAELLDEAPTNGLMPEPGGNVKGCRAQLCGLIDVCAKLLDQGAAQGHVPPISGREQSSKAFLVCLVDIRMELLHQDAHNFEHALQSRVDKRRHKDAAHALPCPSPQHWPIVSSGTIITSVASTGARLVVLEEEECRGGAGHVELDIMLLLP